MLRTAFPVASFIVSLLCLNVAVAADVYKYTDENGKVQYTDKPLKLPAERLNIQSQRSDTVTMEERTDSGDDTKKDTKAAAAPNKTQQQSAERAEAAKREADAAFAANKVDTCNKARSDYLARMGTGRVYEMQQNGERRYLDGAEIDASRATAKKTMDAACN